MIMNVPLKNIDEECCSAIRNALLFREASVRLDADGNLLNLALLSEGFYCELLNELMGWNLENANLREKNAPGIDLIDKEKRIAVQVSLTCDHEKVQSSINKFKTDGSERWHFYFVPIKKDHPHFKKDFALPDWVEFDKDADVFSIDRIMDIVRQKAGIVKQKKIRNLLDLYTKDFSEFDALRNKLYAILCWVRSSHPSFRLMGADPIDEKLFPHAEAEELVPAMGEANGNVAPIWEHIKAEHKEGFRHIIIEGDGGIGKSVSLLSVTDDAELLARIPAIYIHMYDLVSGEGCLTPGGYIDKYISDHAAIDELAGRAGEPKLMLLLDGLNEVTYDLQIKLMDGIKTWSEGHLGAQLIVASRPIPGRPLDLFLGGNALHIALQPIGEEQAAERLRARGVEPPEPGAKIWESLKLPLFLNLYAKTADLPQTTVSGYPLFVRETTGPASLIWNYTQRELLRGTDEKWPVRCAFACEWIAPYIAYRMSLENKFEIGIDEAEELIEEAVGSIDLKALPNHLKSVNAHRRHERNHLPETDWQTLVLDEVGIFTPPKREDDEGAAESTGADNEYSFMHQTFRDCLAGAYLAGIAEAASDTLPEAWRRTVPHLALDSTAELMDEKTADKLWEMNRSLQQYAKPGCKTNTTATYLQLELRERMKKPFEPDFSGMDIRGMSMTRYMGKKETGVQLFRDPRKTKGTYIDSKVFRSDGHTGNVSCVCVLPDGRVVSGSWDNTLCVWDATSGQCLQTLKGHSNWVRCVAVLPDGRVVSGSWDNTLRVWDVDSGQCLQTLEGHSDRVCCVAVLSDGCLVSGSADNTLRVWDVASGQCLKTLVGHYDSVNCVDILPDGCVVSGSSDCTLCVWDASSGQCLQILAGHSSGVICAAVLPDGRVVSGSYDNTLRVWNAASGQCLQTLEEHSNWVECVAVLKDGRVVSGSEDNTLRVWDAATGKCLQILAGHSKWVTCVAVFPDGRVVSGSDDNTLRVWDAATGQCQQILERQNNSVNCVAVLPDGCLVSGSADNTLRVWDAVTGKCLQILAGHSDWILCVAALPDGRMISGSRDNTLRVWDIASGKCLQTLNGHNNWVTCVAVLPDGRVISGSGDDTLRVWDASSGKCLQTLSGHNEWFTCVAVLPNGRVVSGSSIGTLRLWDTFSGQCLKTLLDYGSLVNNVAVLTDGRVVCGLDDNTLRVWDIASGKCLQTLNGHNKWVTCVAVLPDGRVISGSGDDTLRVWDASSGKCLQTIAGHGNGVIRLAVLQDGCVVSGSSDGTLRVWNPNTGSCLDKLEGMEVQVYRQGEFCMDFSKAIIDKDLAQLLWHNGAIISEQDYKRWVAPYRKQWSE